MSKAIPSRWMHREILAAPPGAEVDHLRHQDEFGLPVVDNRRANLRIVTLQENRQHRRKHSGGSSIFKGVTACGGKWRAKIKVAGKTICLGRFRNEAHAALAYDLAAVEYFGAHALTNFPVPGSRSALFNAMAREA